MFRTGSIALLLLLSLLVTACTEGQPAGEETDFVMPAVTAPTDRVNVLLVGWDGVQQNHLRQLLAAGELPWLQRLVDHGSIAEVYVTHFTDTKAGWVQVLTGLEPEQTGVHNNKMFGEVPPGYTVFERAEARLDQVVTVMLTGKKGHMESGPGFPYANLARAIDVWDGDQQRLADEVCPRALDYLQTYAQQRFFMFHHLSDPDIMGHKYGEGSEQYAEAIRTCDRCLGEMLKSLHRNGILDRTVVYITADHGFDESSAPYPINPEKPGYSHIQAPYIFLASSDASQPLVRVGLQRDVAPMMLERLGLPLSLDGIPPLPGTSMTRPMLPW